MAHEIGHALGIIHDRLTNEPNRTDRQGNRCYGIHGLMDDGSRSEVDKFSPCSKQDFRDFFNLMDWLYTGEFCMECCE